MIWQTETERVSHSSSLGNPLSYDPSFFGLLHPYFEYVDPHFHHYSSIQIQDAERASSLPIHATPLDHEIDTLLHSLDVPVLPD